MNRLVRCLGLMLTLGTALAVHGKDYSKLTGANFALLAELHEPIEVASLDRTLLARAIFHESNRVRREHNLPRFRPARLADVAAETQASFCGFRGEIGHDNPLPGLATPLDRIQRAGLKVALVAENISLGPNFAVAPNGEFGVVSRGGRRYFVDPRTGEEVKWHTYETFARWVVQAWMDSPPHRVNLMNPQFELLGCAVWPARSRTGADLIVSTQVFATEPGSSRLRGR